jgi:5-methyltetrahydrofolate--homocysteine methyltransferase
MILIGEKINATRKSIAGAIAEKNAGLLISLAAKQSEAGADYIDVNTGRGISISQELDDMEWLVEELQEAVQRPLAIDSPSPLVIEAGLRHHRNGTPIINSVSAEPDKLKAILPIAGHYNSYLIALAMDSSGISSRPDIRLRACETVAEHARDAGIPLERIFFDPLALPISTDNCHGKTTLETLCMIKKELPGARTTVGLSNISYGLPGRSLLNSVFLIILMGMGLDSAIVDPLDRSLMAAVKAANTILKDDMYCREYLRAFRQGSLTV